MEGTQKSSNEIKLGFKLPFEQAGINSSLSSQNYKINTKNSEQQGKTQVYRMTPQIKSTSRLMAEKPMKHMRQLMVNQGVSQGVASVNSSKCNGSKIVANSDS